MVTVIFEQLSIVKVICVGTLIKDLNMFQFQKFLRTSGNCNMAQKPNTPNVSNISKGMVNLCIQSDMEVD